MKKQIYQIALLAVVLSVVMVSWNKPWKAEKQKKKKKKSKIKFPLQTNTKSLAYHKVKDYDQWKKAFDDFYDIREQSGELSYEVGVLGDDSDMAYVFNTWKSPDDFKNFKEHPALKEKMEEGGVIGAPTFLFLNKLEGNKIKDNKVTALIYHEVEDYHKWKKAFDDFEDTRKEHSEVSYEVGTVNEDPRMIYVIHQWDSLQDYQNLIQDDKLKEAMNAAGVIGEPTFLLLESKDKGKH